MFESLKRFAPVPLRLIVGISFLYYGLPKVFSPQGHRMIVGMFTQIGIPAPDFMTYVVGIVESAAGLAILTGAFAELAALALIPVMGVGLFTVHLPNGFSFINITGMSANGPQFGMPGVEVNLLYIAGLVSIALAGTGPLSLDLRRATRRCGREPGRAGRGLSGCAPASASKPKSKSKATVSALIAITLIGTGTGAIHAAEGGQALRHTDHRAAALTATLHKTIQVGDLEIFYREAGSSAAPVLLLMHGFPTSSRMFRNLIPALADGYRVIAPDYPGYGQSSMPTVDEFEYTFDNITNVMEQFVQTLGLERYSLYVMDYGAPVGFRLAVRHPERVEALIVQNGNAYEEGLRDFWVPFRAYWASRTEDNAAPLRAFFELGATHWQYTHGVRDVAAISPDNWVADQYLLDRPGNNEIQLQLFFDYGSNPSRYPIWQKYFRTWQPPTLIVWGKNDQIFPAEGAHPYKRDLKDIEFHLLDTGHFALEEDGTQIADLIESFLDRKVKSRTSGENLSGR